jgi:hypothetical protein
VTVGPQGIGPRPYPALYTRADSARPTTLAHGRELLRVIGGLPDAPHKLEGARADLLRCLTRGAAQKARGARDVSVALELRGRFDVARLVRRWAGVARGREHLGAEAHYAAEMGPVGIATARAIRWALGRI